MCAAFVFFFFFFYLLKRILALETLRENNSQQILARDQEITSLRQLLQSDSTEVVTSLHAQLNQLRADAGMRERLFQSLKQETEELKNNLAAVSTKCQDLQNTSNVGFTRTTNSFLSFSAFNNVHGHEAASHEQENPNPKVLLA